MGNTITSLLIGRVVAARDSVEYTTNRPGQNLQLVPDSIVDNLKNISTILSNVPSFTKEVKDLCDYLAKEFQGTTEPLNPYEFCDVVSDAITRLEDGYDQNGKLVSSLEDCDDDTNFEILLKIPIIAHAVCPKDFANEV